MAINIGTIKSIGFTNDMEFSPDDRQTLVQTFNNLGVGTVTVEDYGVVDNGEVISLNANFSSSDFIILSGYWKNRTLVTVVLDDGTTINNARIVIRRYKYYDNLLNSYKNVQFEIWRQ